MTRKAMNSTTSVALICRGPSGEASSNITRYFTPLAITKMKRIARAKLMKYIPSARPMIRNMTVDRRPCASGCRAVPLIVAAPASPSPTPAQMAPPASARPAPISPPATAIACTISDVLLSSCGGGAWRRVLRVAFLFQSFSRLPEIDDGQQHENERLNRPDDEDVEELPDDERKPGDDRWNQSHGRDDQDHHYPGKDIAEEPERKAERLGKLFHDVDEDEKPPNHPVGLEGFGVATQISLDAQFAEAVPRRPKEHDERHGHRLVDIRICRNDVRLRQRKKLEPVGDQDVEKDGGGERNDEGRRGTDQLVNLVSCVIEEEFKD